MWHPIVQAEPCASTVRASLPVGGCTRGNSQFLEGSPELGWDRGFPTAAVLALEDGEVSGSLVLDLNPCRQSWVAVLRGIAELLLVRFSAALSCSKLNS